MPKAKEPKLLVEQAENLRFDFINTEQVFEHISEPLETLKELKTLLKPGGIIKISVPTADDINRRLKNNGLECKERNQK